MSMAATDQKTAIVFDDEPVAEQETYENAEIAVLRESATWQEGHERFLPYITQERDVFCSHIIFVNDLKLVGYPFPLRFFDMFPGFVVYDGI